MTPLLAALDRIDAALAAAGFPSTSPWWRAELARFLKSGRRRWVIRAGRRAGKSSTLCRLAVAQALAGAWSTPPGDRAVVAVVSLDRGEAAGRLRTVKAILDALRVPYDERGDEIELRDRPVVIRVVTCSTRGTVGFTAVMVLADEMARWESRDTAANPAAEVMASLRPSMATVASAIEVCVSSPWGLDDYHAELFEAGESPHQVVSFAPTWVANPTITEQRTHELEPDERVWSREYAAVPGATLSAAFDAADVMRAFGAPLSDDGTPWCAIDASSLSHDRFAFALGRMNEGRIAVVEVGAIEASERLEMGEVVARIAARCRAHGVRVVHGDQRESASLRALFGQSGLQLQTHAWTAESKHRAVVALSRALVEGKLAITPHEGLRREMLGLQSRLTPSGGTAYATNGKDYLSTLITLLHAPELAGYGGRRLSTRTYASDDTDAIHGRGEYAPPAGRPTDHETELRSRLHGVFGAERIRIFLND